MKKAQPVRAAVLSNTITAYGDKNYVDRRLNGLTAAWVPGDQGITIILGGFVQGTKQQEPALTVFLAAQSAQRLTQRGFPTNFEENLHSLGVAEELRDKYGDLVEDYEWWEQYNPNAPDVFSGPGFFSGAAHCVILAKSDPLEPLSPAQAYHNGFLRERGNRRRRAGTPDFQTQWNVGRVKTRELLAAGIAELLGDDSWRPAADRAYLLQFDIPEPVKVFLTEDEVEDLKVVLRYQPDWLAVAESSDGTTNE
jgi:hypothetical protein